MLGTDAWIKHTCTESYVAKMHSFYIAVGLFGFSLRLRCYVNDTNPKVPNAKLPNDKVPNSEKTSQCRNVRMLML
jgi:hypothetical protein